MRNPLGVLAAAAWLGMSGEAAACEQEQSEAATKVAAAATGWRVCATATGDLNGDGIADLAALLVKDQPELEGDETVRLRVYWAEKDGKLQQAVEAPAMGYMNSGGAKGGPMPYEVGIAKKVLAVSFFGGSRYSYSVTTKWRWQNGALQLIGLTHETLDSFPEVKGEVANTKTDVNVSTLQMIESVATVVSYSEEKGAKLKTTERRCKAPAGLKGTELALFTFDALKVPECASPKP